MKFQVIRAFSITHNGRRTEYKMGQRIGEAAYRRLSARQQKEYFLSARAAASKTPYTRKELEQIVALYLESGDAYQVRSAFVAANPETGHTAESIRAVAGQLRALDIQHPEDTEWTVKSLVREVAQEIAPERFSGDIDLALDALLVDIRA